LISKFTKNVLTLLTGTSIAQAIPIAITPILTRIYSPEDFGIFALYMSITGILAVVATGRYEMAIILPDDDDDAINLLCLSVLVSMSISLLIFILVFLFGVEIGTLLKNKEISTWLYFTPVIIFLTGIYQSLYYWNNRKRNYSDLSKSRIVHSSVVGSSNLTIGSWSNGPTGLIVGNLIGQLLTTVFLLSKSFSSEKILRFKPQVSVARIKNVAIRYQNFPKYDALASLFNLASHQSNHIFFNLYFGAISSGYFFITQKILGLPIDLIATSIQTVFRVEMTALYNSNGNTRSFFIQTLTKLFGLAIIPSVILYIFAVDIFVLFLGDNWGTVGEYVRYLIPVFLLRFLSVPMSSMFYIAEKQEINTIGQFLLFITTVCTFVLGQSMGSLYTVKLLSIVLSIFYICYLALSFSFTYKR
jgi:O-antigen/teichoic acid export membrane protein